MVYIAEGWRTSAYRWSDPDCFLACDAPDCTRPWVTAEALICWQLHDDVPLSSLFSEQVLIACNPVCLAAAQKAQREQAVWDGRVKPYWSEPASIGAWLDALRDSLSRDPATTSVGELVPVAY